MKVITLTIPAGIVSADLPFYLFYVDLSKLPADLFVSSRDDGGDLRAVDGNDAPLPFWSNRFSKVTKTGVMIIRTPVKAATPTVVKITYDVPDRGKIAVNGMYGQYECFAGFRAFYHRHSLRGGSLGTSIRENAVDGSDIDIVGTINDGNGTPDALTFDGNGYLREDFAAVGVYTLGVVGQRNPGATGDRTLLEYGDRLQITASGKVAAFTADDGPLEGPAYTVGAPVSIGLRRNGTTDRRLYAGGQEYPQLAPAPVAPTQATVGAAAGGIQRLTGAVGYAFIYNGLLPADWFKLDYWNNVDDTLTTPPKPPVEPPTNEDDPVMTLIFVGTSTADVIPIEGTLKGELSSGSFAGKISPYVKEAIQPRDFTDQYGCLFSAEVKELWATYFGSITESTNIAKTTPVLSLRALVANQTFMRVAITGRSTWQLQFWNAGAWTDIGASFREPPLEACLRYDFYFKLHPTAGRVKLVIAGLTYIDFTGKTDYGYGDAAMMILGATSSQPAYYSGIVVADKDTAGYTLHQSWPTGNGAFTSWTGDYTALAKLGTDDTTGISTETLDAQETYTFAGVNTLFQYYNVEAVVVKFRGAVGTNPDKIKGIARIGTEVFEKDAVKPVTPVVTANGVIFDKNPKTGAPWLLTTDFATTQFGFKAAN